MEKVAVLPVPDCACAITSCPLTTGTIARCWIAEGRSKLGVYSLSSPSMLSPVLTRKRKCPWVARALIPYCRSWISDIRILVRKVDRKGIVTYLSTIWSQLDSISFSATSWSSSLDAENDKQKKKKKALAPEFVSFQKKRLLTTPCISCSCYAKCRPVLPTLFE